MAGHKHQIQRNCRGGNQQGNRSKTARANLRGAGQEFLLRIGKAVTAFERHGNVEINIVTFVAEAAVQQISKGNRVIPLIKCVNVQRVGVKRQAFVTGVAEIPVGAV